MKASFIDEMREVNVSTKKTNLNVMMICVIRATLAELGQKGETLIIVV